MYARATIGTDVLEAHLDKLADEIIRRLSNEPDEFYCGLEAKRPFGFSGRWSIARSVCEIIGLTPEGDCDGDAIFTNEQIEYGEYLLDEAPNHIRKRWNQSRAGKPQ